MIASNLQDDSEVVPTPSRGGNDVLPGAVLYGANASGKSNVISALRFMKLSSLYSHSRGEAGAGIPRRPFALEGSYITKPSVFDLDFVTNDTRYHYGFECLDDRFTKEWLYSFQTNRRQYLFLRDGDKYEFGRAFKGKNKTISSLTRNNSLFLSAAIQNDHEEVAVVASFLRAMSFLDAGSASASDTSFAKDGIDARIIRFLTEIGTGVVGYRKSEETPTLLDIEIRKSIFSTLKQHTNYSGEPPLFESSSLKIELEHGTSQGDSVYFSLDWESAGTRRLLVLLSRVFKCIDAGGVMILDELDLHLHTQASEAILALFLAKVTNPHGAQIITTTHDTNLLRPPFLRRDQIWFAEKDLAGATDIYPLSDFRTRKGDNIEKGYLEGRYGAIPFAGSSRALMTTL